MASSTTTGGQRRHTMMDVASHGKDFMSILGGGSGSSPKKKKQSTSIGLTNNFRGLDLGLPSLRESSSAADHDDDKQQQEKEQSKQEALNNDIVQSWYEDDIFKDVTLECSTDGSQVKATRMILAARSEAFYNLLIPITLTNSGVVKINNIVSGEILEAIVEYCYTNQATMLQYENSYIPNDQFIPNCFQLQQTGIHYKLPPSLGVTINKTIKGYITKFPTVCFAAFQSWRQQEDAPFELGEILLDQIRTTNLMKLKSTNLSSLTAPTVKQILQDTKMQSTEYEIFIFLKKWVDSATTASATVAAAAGEAAQRKTQAMELVSLIQLQHIDPTILGTTVATSGLVSAAELMEAYRLQAVAAASEEPPHFHRKRFTTTPVWSHTMTDLSETSNHKQQWNADVLDSFPPMTVGTKFEWTIEFVSLDDKEEIGYSWLGITSKTPLQHHLPLDEQPQACCWSVNDRCRGVDNEGGTAFAFASASDDTMEEIQLMEGHQLTFVLDLSDTGSSTGGAGAGPGSAQEEEGEGGNGTLTVMLSGNGHTMTLLGHFSNLLEYLKKHPDVAGFVPAMSIRDCCVVKALGIPKSLLNKEEEEVEEEN